MNTIAFTLHLLLACLIIFPFLCMLGSVWIGVYFKMRSKYEIDRGVEFINRLKNNARTEK